MFRPSVAVRPSPAIMQLGRLSPWSTQDRESWQEPMTDLHSSRTAYLPRPVTRLLAAHDLAGFGRRRVGGALRHQLHVEALEATAEWERPAVATAHLRAVVLADART